MQTFLARVSLADDVGGADRRHRLVDRQHELGEPRVVVHAKLPDAHGNAAKRQSVRRQHQWSRVACCPAASPADGAGVSLSVLAP